MARPSEINPTLPVYGEAIKKAMAEQATAFNIVRISSFVSPENGPTWRLTITNRETGEMGLILLGKNAVRDDAFAMFSRALDGGEPHIGPCKLVSVRLTPTRSAWEIQDADAPTDTNKEAAAPNTPAPAAKASGPA